MYRIGLNKAKVDNYSFFCPDTPMHLNICQPISCTNRLTSSILRGIKGGTLIDYDNILATLEPKKEEKVKHKAIKKEVQEVVEECKVEEKIDEILEVKEEIEEIKPKRRTKKKGGE